MNDVEVLRSPYVRWWDYFRPLSRTALIPPVLNLFLNYVDKWYLIRFSSVEKAISQMVGDVFTSQVVDPPVWTKIKFNDYLGKLIKVFFTIPLDQLNPIQI